MELEELLEEVLAHTDESAQSTRDALKKVDGPLAEILADALLNFRHAQARVESALALAPDTEPEHEPELPGRRLPPAEAPEKPPTMDTGI